MSVSYAQQSLRPLSEIVQKDNLDDPSVNLYIYQRCSGVYLTMSAMLYKQKLVEESKKFDTGQAIFALGAQYLLSQEPGQNENSAKGQVKSNIEEISTKYVKDMKSNYITNGNYTLDTYIENDLQICKVFFDNIMSKTNQ
tara:strand:+ start:719 stop:1138 length:420 start_codon:yes stop_codon:yes gene_type:complete